MTVALPLLLAPQPVAVALVDQLVDWSVAGIVGRIVVVNQSLIRDDDLRIPCQVIDEGSSRSANLQDFLADTAGIEIVRLCAVGALRNRVALADEHVAEVLASTAAGQLPQAEVVRSQIVGLTLGGAALPESFAWMGWHNLVVAPEDSLAPGAGVTQLLADDHRGYLDAHLLTAVCTVAGAWARCEGSVLDGQRELPGAQVRLLRGFSRLLASGAVEDALVERIAAVKDEYPRPMNGAEQAVQIENETAAVLEMADALQAKHPELRPSERRVPPRRPATGINVWQALKALWGFLWAALKNAPTVWAKAALARASTAVAGRVQSTVFGSGDSQYTVVVRGLRPDGTPASWADVEDSLTELTARSGSATAHAVDHDLSSVWKDFVAGAFTLLDGETRLPEMPAVQIGSDRGIITRVDAVVPPSDDVFVPSGAVAANIKGWRVEPADLLAGHALEDELNRISRQNPMLSTAAAEDKAQLKEWAESKRRTYSGRVGYLIGDAVIEVRKRIESDREEIEAAGKAPALSAGLESEQRSTASKLRWLLVGALLAVLATVLVVVLNIIGLVIGLVVLIVVAGGWLSSSVLVFMKGQQRLFQLINQRDEAHRRLDWLHEQLAASLVDLKRLSRAYRQYVDWSRALGTFLRAPLGTPDEAPEEHLLLGAGHPRCLRFGEARAEAAAIAPAAARLRRSLFRTGWLTPSWDVFLTDFPEALGERLFDLREDPDALWLDRGLSSQSVLTAWSTALSGGSGGVGATRWLREQIRAAIPDLPAQTAEALTSTIAQWSSSGTLETVDRRQFMSGLDADDSGRFGSSVFTSAASIDEPWLVDVTWRGGDERTAVGGSLIVAQLSKGFTAAALKMCAAEEPIIAESRELPEDPTRWAPPQDLPKM